jgi:hypothetical protein
VKNLFCTLFAFLLFGSVTSGATSFSHYRTSQRPTVSAAASTAAAIQSRLTTAGYTTRSLPMVISSVGPSGVGVHVASPNLSPRGQLSFRVEVDFASRHSFNLIVSVYSSAAAAALHLTHVVMDCAALHCHLSEQPYQNAEKRQVIGRVLYDAVSDDGTSPVPAPEFAKLVALASGGA